jgi:hypothetical protein
MNCVTVITVQNTLRFLCIVYVLMYVENQSILPLNEKKHRFRGEQLQRNCQEPTTYIKLISNTNRCDIVVFCMRHVIQYSPFTPTTIDYSNIGIKSGVSSTNGNDSIALTNCCTWLKRALSVVTTKSTDW